MNFPEELRYTKDHEWVKKEGDLLVVGITDFAQSELGDIVYVEIESEGDMLEAEEVFGTVEAVKTVSDLFMPVKGMVVEVNSSLTNTPEVVNNSCYNDGWMIKIKPENQNDFDSLLSPDEYKKHIGK